jgi:hypothetical protein
MARLRGIAWWIVALGAFGLVIPFVGPLFNFGMGPEPAFAVTTSRVLRHVLPGVAIIAGGLLLLSSSTSAQRVGGILAVLGGGVLTAAPLIFGSEGWLQFARRFVYHWGTGLALVVLAAYALGRLVAARAEPREAPTAATSERGREEAARA